MNVLVIDIGGTHIKVASTQVRIPLKVVSGPTMSAKEMVSDVLVATSTWQYDAVSIGYPGPVRANHPTEEPHNLAHGWVGFDYEGAFKKPIRFINDAAMQALGGYKQGRMLFLGTGTGLGSALVSDGILIPLELAHLPYRKGKTYEDYVGLAGLERRGKKKWRKSVLDVVELLRSAFVVDSVLLGGGNAKLMEDLPDGVEIGANSNAILGGIRLWDQPSTPSKPPLASAPIEAEDSSPEPGKDAAQRSKKKPKTQKVKPEGRPASRKGKKSRSR